MLPKNLELYRCRFNCKRAREVICDEGEQEKLPPGVTAVEYALFLLARAIEEIANHLDQQGGDDE
jgi:hypothetical protein